MSGPTATDSALLDPDSPSEFVWLKSFRVDIADEKGNPQPLEFLCHSWLMAEKELLTVSQGRAEMNLPEGFGIRIRNHGAVELLAQALNNGKNVDKELIYKLSVGYIDDAAALRQGLRELTSQTLAVYAKDAGQDGHHHHHHAAADSAAYPEDPVHFEVPPGKHEFASTFVSAFSGRVHYIKLHLHPYGRSIAWVDKTDGKVLWKGYARNATDRVALLSTDEYSSVEGFPFVQGHTYQLVADYDNTSRNPIDAMAVLRIYVERSGAGAR